MNSVSWFLYLIDVIGNIKGVAGVVVIVGGILAGACVIFAPIILCEIDFDEHPWIKGLAKKSFVVWCFAMAAALLMPSQNTMYAIAASEVGEQVIKSSAAQEMTSDAQKALHQWIKRQIEPEAKK